MLYIPALPQQRSEPSISLQFESRNCFQQVSRLAAYALAVGKMTGVLISNGHPSRGRVYPQGRDRREIARRP